MLCHDNLSNFYITQFVLKVDYGFSIEEQNNMIPFERDIHLGFVMERVKQREASSNTKGPGEFPPLEEYPGREFK